MSNKLRKVHNGNRHRGPRPHSSKCGFCGKNQNDVPLMLRSNITNNTICAYCAMNIVTQTMGHMTNVSAAYRQVVTSKPEWFEKDTETGVITMIDPDTELDNALDALDELSEQGDGDEVPPDAH